MRKDSNTARGGASRQLSRHSLLELFYPVPNAVNSLEEASRWAHQDLSIGSRFELRRELSWLDLRLLLDDQPCRWLFERRDAIRRALGDG